MIDDRDWQRAEDAMAKLRQRGNGRDHDRFLLEWMQGIEPALHQSALIRGLIVPGSMIVTYGESGSGKTFHTLHRDICVASGETWFDRECERGFVVYIAAEGAHSARNRIVAYRDLLRDPEECLLALLSYPIDLLDPTVDVTDLIVAIKRAEDACGKPCVKVTADTLARVIAGGNENAPQDMGAVVRNADIIRHNLSCAFEFVHHSGKDALRGARGHSSLRAATDTEIEVRHDQEARMHIAEVKKQRDMAIGDVFAFRLRQVELGKDAYGHPITTCVPEPVPEYDDTPKRKLSANDNSLLLLMYDALESHKLFAPGTCRAASNPPRAGQYAIDDARLWEFVCTAGGIGDSGGAENQKRTYRRTLQRLRDKGLVNIHDGWVWLAN